MGNFPLDDILTPQTGTALVIAPGIPNVLTANRETDARTAITRGLAEYLQTLAIDAIDGRHLAFKRVFQTWAEPEDEADYPSAAVYATEPGIYDSSKFTPSVNPTKQLPPPDGRFVVSPSELVLNVLVDLWATDPEARQELVAMIEDGMNPVEWRYGIMLDLPHYHGERASYELMSMEYIDADDVAQRRIRRAHFIVAARLPVVRLLAFPIVPKQIRVQVNAVAAEDGSTPQPPAELPLSPLPLP